MSKLESLKHVYSLSDIKKSLVANGFTQDESYLCYDFIYQYLETGYVGTLSFPDVYADKIWMEVVSPEEVDEEFPEIVIKQLVVLEALIFPGNAELCGQDIAPECREITVILDW